MGCACVSIGTHRGQRRVLNSVEQELEALLGTELSSLQEQCALLTPEPSLQHGSFRSFKTIGAIVVTLKICSSRVIV